MKVRVELEDPDETIVVRITAFDRRAFEATGRKQIGLGPGPLQAAVQEKPDTYVAWLCWHALTRKKVVAESWPDYSLRHVDHEILDDEEEANGELPDPTRRDPSPVSSSR